MSLTVQRLLHEEFTERDIERTVGIQFKSKEFPVILSNAEEKIKVNFWDTAGIFYFKALTKSHYRRSHGAVIVFDVEK